jgi:DNA-binding IclR family transcriptional regulator
MSVQAMTWAFSLKLGSPSLKVTLLALANRVDDYNTCYPGVARLANETDLSERTVRTCIAKLEELGLLRRARRHTHHGYRTSNSYTLMVGATRA